MNPLAPIAEALRGLPRNAVIVDTARTTDWPHGAVARVGDWHGETEPLYFTSHERARMYAAQLGRLIGATIGGIND